MSPNGLQHSKRSARAALEAQLALVEAEIAEREELQRRKVEREEFERQQAAEARRVALDTADVGPFVPLVSPHLTEPTHLEPVLDLFRRIDRGERVRACISVPTQHGKTEGALHGLGWLIKRHPSWPFIYATYQQDQSDDKSHRARAIARAAGVDLAADRQNLLMWRTAAGGGAVFTSIGGPGSGQPAALGILDDPYKDRHDAMSEARRTRVRSWFSSVLMQRGQEGMSLLVIHTRWLEADLIGDIERGAFGNDWEVINLPMLSEQDASGKWVPSPRPYDTATRVLNPRQTTPDGRVFGWTLAGAQKQLRDTPEADAESMGQGRPRRRVDGALWQADEHIKPWRVPVEPPRSRCDVFVDPNQASAAQAATADDAGIVTISRGVDGRAYVLDDASGHVGVKGWTARAVASYRRHKAHSIVLESDGGGELNAEAVRAHLLQEAHARSKAEGRVIDPEPILIRLVKVGARGDKRGRAETARDLYGDMKAGRASMVSHVGEQPRLEETMTTHDYATTTRSPGDIDALSLGVHELLLSDASQPLPDCGVADYDF